MTLDAPEDPPRLAHREILKEEEFRAYRVADVFPRYRCIMDLMQAGIDKGVFGRLS